MKSTSDLLAIGDRHNSPSYAPARIIFEHGEGVYLYDRDGREYLDFVAGIAVNALGYQHPGLTEALTSQVADLLHVSNMYYTEPQIELMQRLCDLSFGDRVFLCNSGTEANEAAMKLAHRYQREVVGRDDKFGIVSMKKSFHGRTLASLTATGQPKYHKGFEPLVEGFTYGSFNDLDSVTELIDDHTAAVIVEPIQGEGGIRPGTLEFLKGLRELCDTHGALLIFDEVQAGVGRTGEVFAYQNFGVEPDIMCLAKGLGGGVPVGAMLATERVFEGFERGSHASTFGGNPLACRAALTVLDVVAERAFLDEVKARGEELRAGLRALQQDFDAIVDVRGHGLMVGAECVDDVAGRVAANVRDEHRLLVNTAGGTTIRMVPPLIIGPEHVEEALVRLRRAFQACCQTAE